jgi:3'-phosphoadenosine 5'-phosphosulfate sulfotransferase (PAPS reductase)/FAD synthetase
MQALPLEEKIEESLRLIREWHGYWAGRTYVSDSAGKDSCVLLHLARSIYPDIPAIFADTGAELPEIRKFVKSHGPVETVRPKMSFREVIERYGYPVVSKEQARYIEEIRNSKSERLVDIRLNGITLPNGKAGHFGRLSGKWRYLLNAPFKISAKCCDKIKKAPLEIYERQSGRWPMTGEMASESRRRKTNCLMYGFNGFSRKRPKSTPLGFWTEQDILRYLREYSVPY